MIVQKNIILSWISKYFLILFLIFLANAYFYSIAEGDLFSHIINCGSLNEASAKIIFKQLFNTIKVNILR